MSFIFVFSSSSSQNALFMNKTASQQDYKGKEEQDTFAWIASLQVKYLNGIVYFLKEKNLMNSAELEKESLNRKSCIIIIVQIKNFTEAYSRNLDINSMPTLMTHPTHQYK